MPAESQDFALPQRFSGYGSDSNSAEAWGAAIWLPKADSVGLLLRPAGL